MGVEQFRQQAQARLILSPANRKGVLNRIFEAVALFAEHYDHVVYLDHVNIFTTPTGVSLQSFVTGSSSMPRSEEFCL